MTWKETTRVPAGKFWDEVEIRNHHAIADLWVPQCRIVGTEEWINLHKDSKVNHNLNENNLFINVDVTYYVENSEIVTIETERGDVVKRFLLTGKLCRVPFGTGKIKLL